jgi:hypothetical protein
MGSEARGELRLLRGVAVAALGCAGLAACATPLPTRLPPTASTARALFRTARAGLDRRPARHRQALSDQGDLVLSQVRSGL